MVARLFVGKIEPSSQPFNFDLGKKVEQVGILQKYFNEKTLQLSTTVLGGALLQLTICILLPTQWAILPALTLVLVCLINSGIQSVTATNTTPSPESCLEKVIPGRVTAQLPNTEDGSLGPAPADKSLVVFNLGVQWNHPLGPRCPGGMQVFDFFTRMNADLLARREEFGLLSISSWKGSETEMFGPGGTVVGTYFFKDEASIHRFAHEEIHRKGWDWYNGARIKHIGLFHETFIVPAKNYETMYVNCSPTLMGRSMEKCDTPDGAKWVNSLVSADTPVLKTQYGRMGRDAKGNILSYDAQY